MPFTYNQTAKNEKVNRHQSVCFLIITIAYSTLREKKMLIPNDHQSKACLYLLVTLFLKTNKQNKEHNK